MFSQILASTLMLAAQIHQDSFHKGCFEKAKKEGEQKAAVDPANAELHKPDPNKFYSVDIPTAAKIACNLNGISGSTAMIELLLKSSWNESTAWAKETLEPADPVEELIEMLNFFASHFRQ